MPKWMRVFAIVSALAFVVSAGSLVYLLTDVAPSGSNAQQGEGGAARDPLMPREGFEPFNIPAFTALDQDGKAINEAILDGRITVVSFVFTHCPLACPIITEQMSQLTRKLKGSSVRFLSLTLDPANDTPAVLKEYADSYNADYKRWTFANPGFLPGGEATTFAMLKNNLFEHIALDEAAPIKLEDGTTMANIIHPVFIYLVGPGGQVLERFNTKKPEEMAALEARAMVTSAVLAKKLAK